MMARTQANKSRNNAASTRNNANSPLNNGTAARKRAGHECLHCKQWIAEGEPHDCWTTTEAALTRELSDDLREAWERLRETAVDFGEQRIYASHHSIMFARKACCFFVRPKTVEPPISDWLREAYEFADPAAVKGVTRKKKTGARKKPSRRRWD